MKKLLIVNKYLLHSSVVLVVFLLVVSYFFDPYFMSECGFNCEESSLHSFIEQLSESLIIVALVSLLVETTQFFVSSLFTKKGI